MKKRIEVILGRLVRWALRGFIEEVVRCNRLAIDAICNEKGRNDSQDKYISLLWKDLIKREPGTRIDGAGGEYDAKAGLEAGDYRGDRLLPVPAGRPNPIEMPLLKRRRIPTKEELE